MCSNLHKQLRRVLDHRNILMSHQQQFPSEAAQIHRYPSINSESYELFVNSQANLELLLT